MNRAIAWLAVIAVTHFCISTSASRVVKYSPVREEIVVTQDKNHKWEVGDQVCVNRSGNEIACGEVAKANKKTAVVKVSKVNEKISRKTVRDSKSANYVEVVFGKETVRKGDGVEKASENFGRNKDDGENSGGSGNLSNFTFLPGDRKPSSAMPEGGLLAGKDDLLLGGEAKATSDGRHVNPGLMNNVTAGLTYLFPTLQYQRIISDRYALGVMPMYVNTPVGNGNLSGYGGYVTGSYYALEEFRGLFAQIGLGMYSLTGTLGADSGSFSSTAFEATVGWRWFWNNGINFGFGIGAQYLMTKTPENVSWDFSGILPSVALDLGYAF